MSAITIGRSQHDAVALLIEILRTSHLLVQGASGSGKSYLMRVMAELLCEHVQVIIIDPEGEYKTLRKKFPFVLVGEGGETPAAVDTAELLARRLIEVGCSAVCDIYALEQQDQEEWVKTFLHAIIRLPKELWRPLVIIIDEAQLFAPEKGEAYSKDQTQCGRVLHDFSSRCRKHGIGLICATQRITKLANNVVGNLQNYIVGRTFLQSDCERVAKVLGVPSRKSEMDPFISDLRMLKRGQFWALGTAISVERVFFDGATAQTPHPDPGAIASEAYEPPMPAEVRALLPQLADLPKEAAEEAEGMHALLTENTQLRDKVEQLCGDLKAVQLDYSDAIKVTNTLHERIATQEPQVLAPDLKPLRERLIQFTIKHESAVEEFSAALQRGFRDLREGVEEELKAIEQRASAMAAGLGTVPRSDESDTIFKLGPGRKSGGGFEVVFDEGEPKDDWFTANDGNRQGPVQPERARSTAAPRGHVDTNAAARTQSQKDVTNVTSEFSGGAKKLLAALLTYPRGITRSQAKILCGFAERTLTNYVSELNVGGALGKDGRLLRVPSERQRELAGLIGDVPRPPRSTREVLMLWTPRLNGGAVKLLDVLLHAKGQPVRKSYVLEATGFAERTLTNYVSELSVAGLLVKPGSGTLAANKEALFL
jgi:energy-coupling factor transporter ATP-binding protein EcfA2